MIRVNVGFDDYSLEASIYMQLITTRTVILNPMIIKLINIAFITKYLYNNWFCAINSIFLNLKVLMCVTCQIGSYVGIICLLLILSFSPSILFNS